MGLTPETLADLRKKAEAAKGINPANYYPGQTPAEYVAHTKAATPAAVLALLDRIAELEGTYVRPSKWRCDGCSCREMSNDGRRPDAHPSCGGMWVRE